jgi:hypothetical protein
VNKLKTWLLAGLLLVAPFAQSFGAFSGSGGVWYHAKGAFISSPADGNNTGIQSAVNAANNGGFVFIHAGRYRLDSGTIAVGNGVTIEGVGDSTVFEIATNDTAFNIWGNGVTLRNIRIEGKKWNHSSSQGIVVTGDSVTIENVTINDTYDAAIHLHQGSHAARVLNCRINRPGGAASTDGRGVVIHDSNDVLIRNTYVTFAKLNGFWVQGTSQRTKIEGCSSLDATDDNVLVDPTTNHVEILGGTFNRSVVGDGIQADGDSMNVGLNTVVGNRAFGIWATLGGDGSSWWVNNCFENGNYNMAIEYTAGGTHRGFEIVGNFLVNARGINLEIQASNTTTLEDVLVAGNYLIGTLPTIIGGNSLTNMQIVSSVGSAVRKLHIKGNVVKNGLKHGIEVSGTGPFFEGLVITDNDIIDNVDDGLRLNLGASGYAFVSGNVLHGNGTDEPNRLSGVFEGNGMKSRLQGSVAVIEDSLRVNGTQVTSGAVTVNDKLVVLDSLRVMMPLKLGTTSGVPQRHVIGDGGGTAAESLTIFLDGTSNAATQNPKLVFNRAVSQAGEIVAHPNGLAIKVLQGTGSIFATSLGSNVPWLRLDSDGATSGKVVINRSSAGTAQLDVNGNGVFADSLRVNRTTELIGNAQVSAGKLTVADSLRVNRTAEFIGAVAVSAGKLTVADSLRVEDALEVGAREGGSTDTTRIGRSMVFKKYGSTSDIILHNTGNILEFTNDGNNIVRASDAAGALLFQTGGTTTQFSITSGGDLVATGDNIVTLGTNPLASLPAATNGTIIYCSDCNKVAPCTSGGTGAIAKREAGAWNCD